MPEQETLFPDKTQRIAELSTGDRVAAFFALRKKTLAPYQGGTRTRLVLELGDSSGRIQAVIWDGAEEIEQHLSEGGVIRVEGTVGEYKDRPQITVDRVRMALPGEVPPESLLPQGSVPPDEAFKMWREEARSIGDEHLQALFKVLLSDRAFSDGLRRSPAAKLWHHPYVGGLAYHSACVARIVGRACEIHPALDRDLLVAGALLHDIGKIEELEPTTFVDYTAVGRLWGHTYIGARMVEGAADQLPGFPDELRLKLIHLILSHAGTLDMGAAVLPATREAVVLHHADQLDAQFAGFDRVMEKQADKDGLFTDFVNLIERHLYVGPPEGRRRQ